MSEHTKTPLVLSPDSGVIYSGHDFEPYATVYGGTIQKARQRAAHIVKCVNLYDELVAALKANQDFQSVRHHSVEHILNSAETAKSLTESVLVKVESKP